MPPLQGTKRDSKVHAEGLGRKARVPPLPSANPFKLPSPHPQGVGHLAPATRDPIFCLKPNAWLLALFIAAVGIICCLINFLTKKAVQVPAQLEKWRQTLLHRHFSLFPPLLGLHCYYSQVLILGWQSVQVNCPFWASVCSFVKWKVTPLFTSILFSPVSFGKFPPPLLLTVLNLQTNKRVGSEKPYSGFSSITASNRVGIISLIVSARRSLSSVKGSRKSLDCYLSD